MLLAVCALLSGVVLAAVNPPSRLLRLAALPLLRKALHHDQLQLGKLTLRPLHLLELENLELGAPAGFKEPLLRVRRITLQYDLSKLLSFSGPRAIKVSRLEIDQPQVVLEKKGETNNWQAFLGGLPKSEKKADQANSGGGAFPLDVGLSGFRIDEVSARYLSESQRFAINDLDLFASGEFGATSGKLLFGLRLGQKSAKEGNLSLSTPIGGNERIAAQFAFKTVLDLEVDQFDPPAATIRLNSELASHKIDSVLLLPAIKIALRSEARANLGRREASLKQFYLSLNDQPVVELVSTLDDLGKENRLQVELRQLNLPLTMLATYLKPFFPELDFGGAVRLEDVKAGAPLESRSIDDLDDVSGTLRIDNVWGVLKSKRGRPRLSTKDINATLSFHSGKTTTAGEKSLSVSGSTNVGQLKVAGAKLRGIAIETESRVQLKDGKPITFAGNLGLRIPHIDYTHPATGPISTRVKLQLAASGNLPDQSIQVKELTLNIADLLLAKLSGTARLSKRRPFAAELAVAPIHLTKLINALPARVRRQLAAFGLRGKVGLHLKAGGFPPQGKLDPLNLPLHYVAKVSLDGVGLTHAQNQLQGLAGWLELRGKPRASITLSSNLKAKRLLAKAARVELRQIALPIKVVVNESGLAADLVLESGSINTDSFVANNPTRIKLAGKFRLPIHRLIENRPLEVSAADLTLQVDAGDGELKLPDGKVLAKNLQFKARIDHRAKSKSPTQIKTALTIASLSNPRRKASTDGIDVSLKAQLPNTHVRLPRPAIAEEGAVELKLNLKRVRYPSAFKEPLKNNSLSLILSLNKDGRLVLRNCGLNVPTQGLALSASGSIDRALALLSQKFGPLPPLGLGINVSIEKPMAQTLAGAHYLAPGLKMGGMLGLKLSVVGKGGKELSVSGRVAADELSVWKRAVQLRKKTDGNLERQIAIMALKGVNADIPIAQDVHLQFGSGRLSFAVAGAKRSIFQSHQSSSALYRTMRPYLGRQSSFSITEARLKQNVAEINPAGHLLAATDREFKAGPFALDLAIADSSVFLNRLYLGLFDGGISGAIKAQPVLDTKYFDLRTQLQTQITGVNLAYLDPQAKRHGPNTQLSALVDLKYQLCRPDLTHGRVEITKISLEHLDALLAYLDPNNLDKKIQLYRKLLKGLIAQILKPRITRVSIDVRHANLNMDVRIETRAIAAPLGAYVNRLLKQNPIRRFNLLPILPKLCGEK